MSPGKLDDALFDIEYAAIKAIEDGGDFMEEHPLAGQAIGIAVGLLLGTVLVLCVLNPVFGGA